GEAAAGAPAGEAREPAEPIELVGTKLAAEGGGDLRRSLARREAIEVALPAPVRLHARAPEQIGQRRRREGVDAQPAPGALAEAEDLVEAPAQLGREREVARLAGEPEEAARGGGEVVAEVGDLDVRAAGDGERPSHPKTPRVARDGPGEALRPDGLRDL